MLTLAKMKNVSRMMIGRAVKVDIGIKSYDRRRRAISTPHMREIRAMRCSELLYQLKHKGRQVEEFVDEKKFISIW